MERSGILSVNKYKLNGRDQIKVTYFKVPPVELVDRTVLAFITLSRQALRQNSTPQKTILQKQDFYFQLNRVGGRELLNKVNIYGQPLDSFPMPKHNAL